MMLNTAFRKLHTYSLLPGCEVLLFGSSLSGFGLQGSSVDLELSLVLASDCRPHLAMFKTAELLRQSHYFR